jgi:hypothetical protein
MAAIGSSSRTRSVPTPPPRPAVPAAAPLTRPPPATAPGGVGSAPTFFEPAGAPAAPDPARIASTNTPGLYPKTKEQLGSTGLFDTSGAGATVELDGHTWVASDLRYGEAHDDMKRAAAQAGVDPAAAAQQISDGDKEARAADRVVLYDKDNPSIKAVAEVDKLKDPAHGAEYLRSITSRAATDDQSLRRQSPSIRSFDLPRDQPIGYTNLSPPRGSAAYPGYPANAQRANDQMPAALRRAGYDVRTQGGNGDVYTSDPAKALEARVSAPGAPKTQLVNVNSHGEQAGLVFDKWGTDRLTRMTTEAVKKDCPQLTRDQPSTDKTLDALSESRKIQGLDARVAFMREQMKAAGLSPSDATLRTALRSYDKQADAWNGHNDKALTPPERLLDVAARHPDKQFVFTVDSCYTGGFQAAMSRPPYDKLGNVKVITATSGDRVATAPSPSSSSGPSAPFFKTYLLSALQKMGDTASPPQLTSTDASGRRTSTPFPIRTYGDAVLYANLMTRAYIGNGDAPQFITPK